MNYYKDLQSMISGQYFGNSAFSNGSDMHAPINTLVEKLKLKSEGIEPELKDILDTMTELWCYKAVLEMDVKFQEVPTSWNKEKKQLHARGYLTYEKGKRIWSGIYLAPMHEISNDKQREDIMKKGRVEVMFSVFQKLKKALHIQ